MGTIHCKADPNNTPHKHLVGWCHQRHACSHPGQLSFNISLTKFGCTTGRQTKTPKGGAEWKKTWATTSVCPPMDGIMDATWSRKWYWLGYLLLVLGLFDLGAQKIMVKYLTGRHVYVSGEWRAEMLKAESGNDVKVVNFSDKIWTFWKKIEYTLNILDLFQK